MGKRMYGIRSFAYRIPYPHAAAASRLRLPRIWNPSLRGQTEVCLNTFNRYKNIYRILSSSNLDVHKPYKTRFDIGEIAE